MVSSFLVRCCTARMEAPLTGPRLALPHPQPTPKATHSTSAVDTRRVPAAHHTTSTFLLAAYCIKWGTGQSRQQHTLHRSVGLLMGSRYTALMDPAAHRCRHARSQEVHMALIRAQTTVAACTRWILQSMTFTTGTTSREPTMVEPRARPLRVPHLELATIRTLQCASVDAAHLELAALTAV